MLLASLLAHLPGLLCVVGWLLSRVEATSLVAAHSLGLFLFVLPVRLLGLVSSLVVNLPPVLFMVPLIVLVVSSIRLRCLCFFPVTSTLFMLIKINLIKHCHEVLLDFPG